MLGLPRRLSLPILGLATLAACSGGETVDPLSISTTSLPAGALDTAYDQKVSAVGGTAPYAFTLSSGALPAGFDLAVATGQIRGQTTEPGTFDFTVTVTDADDVTATANLSIYIEPAPLNITTTTLDDAFEAEAFAVTLEATGGIAPFTWAVESGNLPAGLTLSNDGELSGTPTEAGMFSFEVRVTDTEDNFDVQALQLVLSPIDPMIETDMVPLAVQDQPYDQRLVASGGKAPYTWTVESGSFPMGLQLQSDGLIFGTPTVAGDYTFVAQVEDDGGRTDMKTFDLPVIGELSITTRNIDLMLLGEPVNFQFEATGGLPPYTWALRGSDPLPAGITLSETGLLSGTPTQEGDFPIRIQVVSGFGSPRSAQFTVRVRNVRQYRVDPGVAFPPVCDTSTNVSYQYVDIEVPDAFAIDSIEVAVDVSYTDNIGGDNDSLKLVLRAPDNRPLVLCGNGAAVRLSEGCRGTGGIQTTYARNGSSTDTPIRTLDGMNAQGTWRFGAAVVNPRIQGGNCGQSGVINSVTLTMEADGSSDPYVMVTGFTRNNLVVDPWVRIQGGGLPQQSITLSASLWDVGPNGRREGGGGDDVVQPNVFTWQGSGLPGGASITSDGVVVSGDPVSGPGSMITATEPGGISVTVPLHVVPPDWNPEIRDY